jgi:hypothetical protein
LTWYAQKEKEISKGSGGGVEASDLKALFEPHGDASFMEVLLLSHSDIDGLFW